ncbi:hypothetical protein ACFSKN_11940 [Mariniflexile gromovii]|uniref:Uncharacterized protein n=1 Tax=Mariniflexile gromovii TaxID=362523 RepID=A0ABS4BVI5_9FLAO|nr:hypothetical protein [Mariniflexile gromovii]MBP0904605.1 hypothetical protein [Mariniflexile gromovii]
MNKIKEHIVFKTITTALALLLLVPSGAKFAHIFAHHTHDICKGEKATHLHEVNTDCDFYKFKLSSTYYYVVSEYIGFIKTPSHSDPIITPYNYLKNHWQLPFSLRGPPVLV